MNLIEKIRKEAQDYFIGANGCHAWDHTERVISNCLHIGKKENADLEILEIATILHDIKKPEEMQLKGAICHAVEAAKESRKILEKFSFPEEKIDKICHCIESHRNKNEIVPNSLEAKILFDADKLDSLGAIGVGRLFMFASVIGARLHNKDVDLENTTEYSSEDTAYREFLAANIKLKDKMLTNEGKRMAQERHDFMISFFDRINKEVDGEL
jgi:uncharacterized protein